MNKVKEIILTTLGWVFNITFVVLLLGLFAKAIIVSGQVPG